MFTSMCPQKRGVYPSMQWAGGVYQGVSDCGCLPRGCLLCGVHPLDQEADTLRGRHTVPPRPKGRQPRIQKQTRLRPRGRHPQDPEADTLPWTQRQTHSPGPRGRHTLLDMTIEASGMHPTAMYQHADATRLRLQHSFLRIMSFHFRVQNRGCTFCKRMISKDDALPE